MGCAHLNRLVARKANITVILLDDKNLGIDFLNMVKAFFVPYTNTMCIMENGQPCVVLVKREIDEGKMLSAFQFTKGIKRKEPTFLATPKLDEELRQFNHPRPSKRCLTNSWTLCPPSYPKDFLQEGKSIMPLS